MKQVFAWSGIAGMMVLGTMATAQAEELRFTSWGGNFQTAQREIYLEAFKNETGIPFAENSYQGGWGQSRAMVDTQNVPWDVVEVESAELVQGCEQGLFVQLV